MIALSRRLCDLLALKVPLDMEFDRIESRFARFLMPRQPTSRPRESWLFRLQPGNVPNRNFRSFMLDTCEYMTDTAMSSPIEFGQAPTIAAGPYGCFNDDESQAIVFRGHTNSALKPQSTTSNVQAPVKASRSRSICVANVRLKYGSLQTPSDLLFQYCLPLIVTLAPRTSLGDTSLESFLHAPNYHLELVAKFSRDEAAVIGQNRCFYTPVFLVSPVPLANLPALLARILVFTLLRFR
jgi:hypothetical protein